MSFCRQRTHDDDEVVWVTGLVGTVTVEVRGELGVAVFEVLLAARPFDKDRDDVVDG